MVRQQQRHAALAREQAVRNARETIETCPQFHSIKVKLYELENEIAQRTPPESLAYGTDGRATLALELFNARAETYLKAVTSMEFNKAYQVLVDYFARLAFKDYTGYPIEILEPLGPTGLGITAALQKRARHWANEGDKIIAALESDAQPATAIKPIEMAGQPEKQTLAATRQGYLLPLLKDKGMSQSKWASEAGVDPSVVYDYLAGKSTPRADSRKVLAEVLSLKSSDLPE